MSKLKTKKALVKRVKITKKGKILRSKSGRRHLLSGKSKKRKRGLKKKGKITHSKRGTIKKSLPYAF